MTDTPSLGTLFRAAFSPDEGDSIAALVTRLMAEVPPTDLRVLRAGPDGAALLTRMHYPGDARIVWLLSPVAVHPDRQGQGVGTAMLRDGLDGLRAEGADLVVTYGDPAFYGRLGFVPVTTDTVPAPYSLSQPHGWQAVSLTGAGTAPFAGAPRVAAGFADPALW